MKVDLITYTPNPEIIVAAAAKCCYSSSNIQDLLNNLNEENTQKFLDKLLSFGHYSPIEHISFTFGIEGVSRSLTHQLVRHRIASYSQKSQRYVKEEQFEYIIPPEIEKRHDLKDIFIEQMSDLQNTYNILYKSLLKDYIEEYCIKNSILAEPNTFDWFKEKYKLKYNELEKKAIEDARYVFPNACNTQIIATFNFRSLINLCQHRNCNRAQWEIRELAHEITKLIKPICPTLYKLLFPSCCNGKCKEGNMTCGKMIDVKEFFDSI